MVLSKPGQQGFIFPNELLIPIFELLAADGAKRTLSNLLMADKNCLAIGLPIRFQVITIDGQTLRPEGVCAFVGRYGHF